MLSGSRSGLLNGILFGWGILSMAPEVKLKSGIPQSDVKRLMYQ